MSETEQDKSEEATPFKLKKAREKGNVAKGSDLAFFGTLVGLAFYIIVFGADFADTFSQVMRKSLSVSIQNGSDPSQIGASIAESYASSIYYLIILGGIIFTCVLLVQLLQTRGLLFTTHPLKPDFSKLNPGKGLKRIFSVRTLKEALKNIFKMSIYLGSTYLLIMYCLNRYAIKMLGGEELIHALYDSGLRLMFLYLFLALIFSVIDQIIVRKEFSKQMRMSKSELKREIKDREGEPRIKQKRKQLHQEFSKQMDALGRLPGSDMLIVNPKHFAVGIAYDAATMQAPKVTAKGQNKFALLLKDRAFSLGIPIIEDPPLARSIFKSTHPGNEISSHDYQKTASIYLRLHRDRFDLGRQEILG